MHEARWVDSVLVVIIHRLNSRTESRIPRFFCWPKPRFPRVDASSFLNSGELFYTFRYSSNVMGRLTARGKGFCGVFHLYLLMSRIGMSRGIIGITGLYSKGIVSLFSRTRGYSYIIRYRWALNGDSVHRLFRAYRVSAVVNKGASILSVQSAVDRMRSLPLPWAISPCSPFYDSCAGFPQLRTRLYADIQKV